MCGIEVDGGCYVAHIKPHGCCIVLAALSVGCSRLPEFLGSIYKRVTKNASASRPVLGLSISRKLFIALYLFRHTECRSLMGMATAGDWLGVHRESATALEGIYKIGTCNPQEAWEESADLVNAMSLFCKITSKQSGRTIHHDENVRPDKLICWSHVFIMVVSMVRRGQQPLAVAVPRYCVPEGSTIGHRPRGCPPPRTAKGIG